MLFITFSFKLLIEDQPFSTCREYHATCFE